MHKEVKIGMGVGLILICASSLYFFAKPEPESADGVKIGLPPSQEHAAGEADSELANASPSAAENIVASFVQPSADPPFPATSAQRSGSAAILAVPLAKDLEPVLAPDSTGPPAKEVATTALPTTANARENPVPAKIEKSPSPVKIIPVARSKTFHKVEVGESLYTIARDHYGDPSKHKLILAANPKVVPKAIPVGYRLVLPAAKPKPELVTLPTGGTHRYTVRPGDTLIGIAQRLFGDQKHFKAIYDANKMQFPEGPDHLKSGLVLVLPGDLERVEKATRW